MARPIDPARIVKRVTHRPYNPDRIGRIRSGEGVTVPDFFDPQAMSAAADRVLADASAWLTREFTLALYVKRLLGEEAA